MKLLQLIAITVGFTGGCQTSREVPDFSEQITYTYKAIVYTGNPDNHEIFAFKYFDNKGNLIEEIGYEYRVKLIYSKAGQLIQKHRCRVYNCEAGWWQNLLYDSAGNNIGELVTTDTSAHLNKMNVEQVKFYDKNNRIIKELSGKGSDVYGYRYEYWKYYTYDNAQIADVTELRNKDTVWTGVYHYDVTGNLISIKRQNGLKYKNEAFQYDQLNRLIKKSIECNDYPLTEDVSISANNNSTTFRYDEKGRLIEEVTFNHKGEEYMRFTFEYQNKNK